MWDPNNPNSPPPSTGGAANPNARYAYLVGRLRARQVTMEEATELFGIMQGMLQRSEAGRQALMAASRTRGLTGASTPTAVPAPRTPPSAGGSDDMLLFGLLAMGAGAGLVAALAKRIQDGPLTPAAPPPRSKPVSSSR
ncbi:MAG: hypothetical protein WB852_09455 [Thermoplasmata archaeon]